MEYWNDGMMGLIQYSIIPTFQMRMWPEEVLWMV